MISKAARSRQVGPAMLQRRGVTMCWSAAECELAGLCAQRHPRRIQIFHCYSLISWSLSIKWPCKHEPCTSTARCTWSCMLNEREMETSAEIQKSILKEKNQTHGTMNNVSRKSLVEAIWFHTGPTLELYQVAQVTLSISARMEILQVLCNLLSRLTTLKAKNLFFMPGCILCPLFLILSPHTSESDLHGMG